MLKKNAFPYSTPRITSLVLGFFLYIFFMKGQNCDVRFSGKILDLDDNEPLAYATLVILETEIVSTTDSMGIFSFENLCPGKYTLSIRHLDCTDTIIPIGLTISKSQTFRLPHSAVLLKDLDVYAESKQVKATQASQVISGQQLQQAQGGNLADITNRVNGLTSRNTGSTISKPMIHGLDGYRILILNNGIRLEGQQWGNEHAPEIDPYLAKKITVIKGAAGVRYGGDALAGAILVEPEDLPDSSSITGELNFSGNTNGKGGAGNAILQGGIKKIPGLAWRVQGTFRKQGNIRTPDYYLSTTALEEKNFSYTVGYHQKRWGTEVFYSQFNTRIGIFSGSHIGNLTDLNYAFQNSIQYDTAKFSYAISRPFQDVSHELVKGNLHFHTGKRSRVNFNYGYQFNQRKEFDKDKALNDSLAKLNLPDLDYRIETQFGEIVWDHDNIRSFRGMLGMSFMHQENVYRGRYFIPNFINNTFGFFAIERWIRKKIEAEAALRYDKKNLNAYLWENDSVIRPTFLFEGLSYNTGVIVKLDSNHRLLFNSGYAWRSPAVNELFSNGLHHGAASIEKGDRDLRPERGFNSILTYQLSNKKITGEINVYSHFLKNFIYQEPGSSPQLSIKGAFPVFFYRQCNALINGTNISLRYPVNDFWELSLKGMYLRGDNLSNKEALIYMPANRVSGTLQYHLRNKKNHKNSFICLETNYVLKQNRVPKGIDYKPAPADYLLFGISFGSQLKFGKETISIYATVNNLLNTRYRDYLDRFRYFCDAPGRNFSVRMHVPINNKKNQINNHENK